MTCLTRALALTLALAAGPVLAQQGDAPAAPAAPELSMGQPAPEAAAEDGPGSSYVAATFDAWEQRCVREADGSDPCQLYQLLKDAEGNPVAEISLFALPRAQQAAVAGATIIVPLETLLPEGLTLAVDGANPKRYPLTFCAPIGCIARVGFTAEEIEAFRKGATATLSLLPALAPDQRVTLTISLKGFTAGYAAAAATIGD
ncbi:MAG: invasion associated locus B family protein [Rhodobacterales bacterium]|nr:invasion associated locus B family protein [Rhodobacterales bacterium]